MKWSMWLVLVVLNVAVSVRGQEAPKNKLIWHTDYHAAAKLADDKGKMLVLHVYEKEAKLKLNAVAEKALANAILCQVPMDYKVKDEGREVPWSHHPIASDLKDKKSGKTTEGLQIASYTWAPGNQRGALAATLNSLPTRSEEDIALFLAVHIDPSASPTFAEVIDRINTARANRGLARVEISFELMRAAQSHADTMARNRNFTFPQNAQPLSVVIGRGLENAQQIVSGWMSGDVTRRTILGNHLRIGVGVASGDGGLSWVAQFGN